MTVLNREGNGALQGILEQKTQVDDAIPVCVLLPCSQARRAARIC